MRTTAPDFGLAAPGAGREAGRPSCRSAKARLELGRGAGYKVEPDWRIDSGCPDGGGQ
ncbi:MAG: hypothetical protein HFG52_05625 [Lachnospiraceae bacterium]|nr:hypothetical protein [Lachnospiraceae bacterium]